MCLDTTALKPGLPFDIPWQYEEAKLEQPKPEPVCPILSIGRGYVSCIKDTCGMRKMCGL